MKNTLLFLGFACGVVVARVAGEWGVVAAIIAILSVVGFVWVTSDILVRRRFNVQSGDSEAKEMVKTLTATWRGIPAGLAGMLTASWLASRQGIEWGLGLAFFWGLGQVADGAYAILRARRRFRDKLLNIHNDHEHKMKKAQTLKKLDELMAEIEEAEKNSSDTQE